MIRNVRDIVGPYFLFGVFAILVLISSGTDVIEEIMQGEPLQEMIDDVIVLLLGILVVWQISRDLLNQKKSMDSLEQQLQSAKGQLARQDKDSTQLASQYRQVMQRQFERWKLTPSEEDVSLCLLKGLSFREIAAVRDTGERTVRQQAAAVYRKAGLSGRHELAAWFFEDMLIASENA